jgi:hypothetical protein
MKTATTASQMSKHLQTRNAYWMAAQEYQMLQSKFNAAMLRSRTGNVSTKLAIQVMDASRKMENAWAAYLTAAEQVGEQAVR